MAFAFSVTKSINEDEPMSYKEAVTSKDKDKWLSAMKEEIQSLYKNNTWKLVDRPSDQKIVGCKWIFKRKKEATGKGKVMFKAKLVAQGFT